MMLHLIPACALLLLGVTAAVLYRAAQAIRGGSRRFVRIEGARGFIGLYDREA